MTQDAALQTRLLAFRAAFHVVAPYSSSFSASRAYSSLDDLHAKATALESDALHLVEMMRLYVGHGLVVGLP